MTKQPEALRLIELLLKRPHSPVDFLPSSCAKELRRLHEENEKMLWVLQEAIGVCLAFSTQSQIAAAVARKGEAVIAAIEKAESK